ncbi:hypothetical protein [Nocardiopsis alba]|uniref:hypothetical protein n=1 Tax=Nocardiopsis alba TaxID=53437 RepID=UPI0035DAED00
MTNDLIMSSVRPEQSGQAAAVSETAYELGTAFGTAILGSVLLGFYRTDLADTAPAECSKPRRRPSPERCSTHENYRANSVRPWPRPPPTRSRPRSRQPEGSPR